MKTFAFKADYETQIIIDEIKNKKGWNTSEVIRSGLALLGKSEKVKINHPLSTLKGSISRKDSEDMRKGVNKMRDESGR